VCATSRDQRGAAAVEFALIAMPFFLLLFGMIQYGMWFNDSLNVRQGVREAARQAVVENFPSCGGKVTTSDKLICNTKQQVSALTGPTYAKVFAPHGWAKGQPLVVCAMVKSNGAVGLLPLPDGGWITSETQMSIEQQAMAANWTDKAEALPSGASWSWCTSS
jgi:Flp pilus assembly protein TadG